MAPPRKINCKTCGVLKTVDNCGFQIVNGKQYWQGHCKKCSSEWTSIKRNANGYYEYVIYVFKDTGGTVTYVGSTANYHQRIIIHRSKGTIFPNEVSYIVDTKECLTKEEGAAWAKLNEDLCMDVHQDTIRNQRASAIFVRPRSVHGTTAPSASSDSDDSNWNPPTPTDLKKPD